MLEPGGSTSGAGRETSPQRSLASQKRVVQVGGHLTQVDERMAVWVDQPAEEVMEDEAIIPVGVRSAALHHHLCDPTKTRCSSRGAPGESE